MTAERSDLTRRRALQLGAGAAFSTPTIVSLATTPAYASAGSGGPITIDSFTLAQVPGLTLSTDGSFLFSSRTTFSVTDGSRSSVSGGILTISKSASGPTPSLLYTSSGGPDLSDCGEIVLENITQVGRSPRIAIRGPGGPSGPIPGSVTGSSLVFDISSVPAATLAAPTRLSLRPDGPTTFASAIRATGPLTAQ
ncbi:MAG: hypothetical protein GY925_04010 [Actinomycetia bacterium]|nr:hypothetical protein [Actinomycetes bacterium]